MPQSLVYLKDVFESFRVRLAQPVKTHLLLYRQNLGKLHLRQNVIRVFDAVIDVRYLDEYQLGTTEQGKEIGIPDEGNWMVYIRFVRGPDKRRRE